MSDSRIDAAIAEYLQAAEAGAPIAREDWLSKHTELRAELEQFLADQSSFARAAAPIDDDKTLAPIEPGSESTGSANVIRYFGDYELLEVIARGGMGMVWKARQVSLNRLVAVKMILAGQLASDADVQRFRTEAEAAANLGHPNILPIYEVGTHEGHHYFSMKLVDGGSLADLIRARSASKGSIDRPTIELLAKVARAVHFAHQRGILHRDLKPANILVDKEGVPYVTDFGLARHVARESGLTQTGAIVGTPSYMAPEQARAEKALSTAVDVYSLGAILYEMLTGQPPFKAATQLDTILQVLEKEPTDPVALDRKADATLAAIALQCLEKKTSQRYPSAEALAGELERWLEGKPVLARRAKDRRGKSQRLIRAAGVMVIIVSACVWWCAGESGGPRATIEVQLTSLQDAVPQEAKEFALGGHRLAAIADRSDADGFRVRIYDLQAGALIGEGAVIGELADQYFPRPWRLLLSPDGNTLAVGISEKIELWQTTDMRRTATIRSSNGGIFRYGDLALLPNGTLVTIARDKELRGNDEKQPIETIQVWDATTGEERIDRRLSGHGSGWILSPDVGRAVGIVRDAKGAQPKVAVYDVPSGQLRTVMNCPSPDVFRFAIAKFSPDGKLLAVQFREGQSVELIHLVRTDEKGEPTRRSISQPGGIGVRDIILGPGRMILGPGGVDLNPGEKSTGVAVRYVDNSVGVMFLSVNKQGSYWKEEDEASKVDMRLISPVAFSPDSKMLVLDDKSPSGSATQVWQLGYYPPPVYFGILGDRGEHNRMSGRGARFLNFSSDGKTVITWNQRTKRLSLWDTDTFLVDRRPLADAVNLLAIIWAFVGLVLVNCHTTQMVLSWIGRVLKRSSSSARFWERDKVASLAAHSEAAFVLRLPPANAIHDGRPTEQALDQAVTALRGRYADGEWRIALENEAPHSLAHIVIRRGQRDAAYIKSHSLAGGRTLLTVELGPSGILTKLILWGYVAVYLLFITLIIIQMITGIGRDGAHSVGLLLTLAFLVLSFFVLPKLSRALSSLDRNLMRKRGERGDRLLNHDNLVALGEFACTTIAGGNRVECVVR